MSDQRYWLGFSLIPYIGPRRILRLRQWFGDLAAAWSASGDSLREAGLDERALKQLLSRRDDINLDAQIEKVRVAGAWLLTLDDERYPALLRQIDDPPPVLYVRGTLAEADELALSIVGTRKATRYGQQVTHDIARKLARSGVTVVSGLAQGVDGAAHQGALQGGGRTIAVLGSGIDVIYPREHAELARRIVASGALISEFPLGTQPTAANFPRRNRVVSGMALGVLVTEAPERSGALITAGLAAEQGREVFAVPGNIYSAASGGTNRLIQDGARLVCDVRDILDELNVAHTNTQTRTRAEQIAPASDIERAVMQHLSVDPIHIDDLVRLCGLTVADVSGTLTLLELKGLAQMVGHMQYSLVYRQ